MPGPGKYGNKKDWAKQVKLVAIKQAKDRLHRLGANGAKRVKK